MKALLVVLLRPIASTIGLKTGMMTLLSIGVLAVVAYWLFIKGEQTPREEPDTGASAIVQTDLDTSTDVVAAMMSVPTPTPRQGLDPRVLPVTQPPPRSGDRRGTLTVTTVGAVAPPAVAVTDPIFDQALFGGSLVYVLEAPPLSLDTMFTPNYAGRSVNRHIFEQVLAENAYGVPTPDMAKVWKLTDNVWSFQLRPNLTFHDGSPVTSHDVQASLERWLKSPDPIASSLRRQWAGFHVIDDQTFDIYMSESSYLPLTAVSRGMGHSPTIHPQRVIHATPPDQPLPDFTGSGPYMFSEWLLGEQHIKLSRHDHYVPRTEKPTFLAGAKIPYIETITAVSMDDHEARLAAVITGAADYVAALDPAYLADALNHSSVVTARVNRPGFQVEVAFNTLNEVMDFTPDGTLMRRGIQKGLSATGAMSASGLDSRLWQLCPSLLLCGGIWENATTDPDFLYDQGDTVRASDLIRRTGYVDETIVVLNPLDLPVLSRLASSVAEQLAEVGLRVHEENTTWAGALTIANGVEDWHILPTYSRSTLYHPLTSLHFRVGGASYPRDSDTGFLLTELHDVLIRADSLAEQQEVANRMSKAAWSDPMRVPLGQYFTVAVHRNTLANVAIRDNPGGIANFLNVRWEDQERLWENPKPVPEGIRVLTGQ